MALAVQVQPHAHSALARTKVERIVDPAPPDGEVGVFELDVDVPAPRAPVVEIASPQFPADVERGCEPGGRLGPDGKTVPEKAIAQDEIERA